MKINDKVYYIFKDNIGDIIVEAFVEEINNIYNIDGKTVWNTQLSDFSEAQFSFDKNTGINERSNFSLEGKIPISQFFWIDEPVGHSLQLESYDGCFLNLNEAIKFAKPSKKKNLLKRLKKHRKRIWNFIISTWDAEKADIKIPKYKNKKVYVKKK